MKNEPTIKRLEQVGRMSSLVHDQPHQEESRTRQYNQSPSKAKPRKANTYPQKSENLHKKFMPCCVDHNTQTCRVIGIRKQRLGRNRSEKRIKTKRIT